MVKRRYKNKFNPVQCGFEKRKDKDGEIEYVLIENNKVIGQLYHINYKKGLPTEWSVHKVVYTGGETKNHIIFDGRIPTNTFAKALLKNIFF